MHIIDLIKQTLGGKATWVRELFVKLDTKIATPCFVWIVLERASFSFPPPWPGQSRSVILSDS